ncbi:MAG: phosphoesterase PA-phosphatase, partial [Clostridia bacterium]|nr:phosphoesterase PA-phosphatase [Clostridia bacterium]
MSKKTKIYFILAAAFMAAFILWTALISVADVQSIGPEESEVGFATINGAFHRLTGEHLWMYDLTDLLSLIPLGSIALFGIIGLVQWIKRKGLLKVDFNILALGGFYVVVMAFFVFFEKYIINYRPMLIEGVLEASYPSSTTMLVMCVMPTAMMQLYYRIQNKRIRNLLLIA